MRRWMLIGLGLSGCLFPTISTVDHFEDALGGSGGDSSRAGSSGTSGSSSMTDAGAPDGGTDTSGGGQVPVGGKAGNAGTNNVTGGKPSNMGDAGMGGTGDGPPTWKNYQRTGSWPEQPIAIATKPGKLAYTRLTIHTRFLAESCAIADYNNDGTPDVSSGRRWFEGPGFDTVHVFRDGHDDLPREGASTEIDTGIADDSADYAFDMNDDGYADIINVASPDTPDAKIPNQVGTGVQAHATAYWYENPGKGVAVDAQWKRHLMHADVRAEHHGLFDIDGDGKPELFGACKSCLPTQTKGYYSGNWQDPTSAWTYHPVTQYYAFPFGGLGWFHGMGFNDVNGDGTPDLLERGGAWLDATSASPNTTVCPATKCGWVSTNFFHVAGTPGDHMGPSHIYAYDIDGDGDKDVIAADWAHGWGLAWYEQGPALQFTRRQFMGSDTPSDLLKYGMIAFSQPHAMQVADMDGDGVPDMITGKMRFANPIGYNDPDPSGTPVSYVFKTQRNTPSAANGGSVTFELHKLDADTNPAGVGRQIAIGHVDTDGILDACVASKLGLFVYYGQ